jgi:alkyl sulfatase BDS1-like metallo-beta-lactamase superfamily hydrolase
MTSRATDATRRTLEAFTATLPLSDTQDFDDVARGFVGASAQRQITAADGRVVWDLDAYGFLDGPAPDTANPSLWRQGQLLAKDGLFEVTSGIYQVRGFDLSNMTIVEGDSGVIVIDPLISKETAAAAFALYVEHRGDRPVVAMIYTHSHIDHFGGVKGIISQQDVDSGRVSVIAPEGFMEHAIVENVYAGTAMGRRAGYMYGAAVAKGPDADRRRAGSNHLHRRADADCPHDRHHRHWPGTHDRRRPHRVPDYAGHRGTVRDEFLLPGPKGPLCG